MVDERRLYDIYLTTPATASRPIYVDGRPTGETQEYESRKNVQAAVLAIDLDDALALVRAEYPACSIWNVTHRGNRVMLAR